MVIRLVATLAVMGLLLSGCSGGGDDLVPAPAATVTVTETATAEPEPTESASPETSRYDDALALLATGDQSQRVLAAWQSPSGNIHCMLDDNGFDGSCEVLQGRIEPAEADLCSFEAGESTVGRIEIFEGSVTPVCNTDTIMNPNAPVLEYGAVAKTEGFISCISERRGMTCVNTDIRKGFFLARGVYEIFENRSA